jgi:uncharacterized protein (TIGR00106 family)
MAIIEVRITPVGTRDSSMTKYVARAVDAIKREKDVKYQITATGTIMEGDLDKIMGMARKMHDAVFDVEVNRVLTTIEIDDRRDKTGSLESGVKSVETKLSRA